MAEAAQKPVPPRPPPVELKPILAGRLIWAIAMLLGLGLVANPVFNSWIMRSFAPPEDLHNDLSKWREGGETDVRVTVITADSTRLSCAHATEVDGAHCGYGEDHMVRQRGPNDPVDDNGPNLIQPYRTSPDNALVLLIGLWAQPEVATRLHREPPSGIPVKRLQRFDVTCRAKFLTKFEKVDLRWDVTGSWQPEKGAWVARVLSCTVNKS